MAKSFNRLHPFAAGEVLSFVHKGTRQSIAGVASGPTLVWVQGDDMDAEVLLTVVYAGEFKFDVGHPRPFSIWFEPKEQGAVVFLHMAEDALELRPSMADTWTSVEHRPAMDPALAAVRRQMMEMQSRLRHVEAARARAEKSAVKASATSASASEPAPAPATEPAPAPATEPAPAPATEPAAEPTT